MFTIMQTAISYKKSFLAFNCEEALCLFLDLIGQQAGVAPIFLRQGSPHTVNLKKLKNTFEVIDFEFINLVFAAYMRFTSL